MSDAPYTPTLPGLLNSLEAQITMESGCGCGLCPHHRTDGTNLIRQIREQQELILADNAALLSGVKLAEDMLRIKGAASGFEKWEQDLEYLILSPHPGEAQAKELTALRKDLEVAHADNAVLLETLVMAEETLSSNGFDNDWVHEKLIAIDAVIHAEHPGASQAEELIALRGVSSAAHKSVVRHHVSCTAGLWTGCHEDCAAWLMANALAALDAQTKRSS